MNQNLRRNGGAKTLDECIRSGPGAMPEREVQNELGIPFDGDGAVRIAEGIVVRLFRQLVSFVLADMAQISSC